MAPLTKPLPGSGRLERRLRKAAARVETSRLDRQQRLEAREIEHAIRQQVYERDNGRCRACGEALTFSGNLFEMMHAHHLVYRSSGGVDLPVNRCALCYECHNDEHDKVLRISGDPDAVLEFTRVNPETGKILDCWESDVR